MAALRVLLLGIAAKRDANNRWAPDISCCRPQSVLCRSEKKTGMRGMRLCICPPSPNIMPLLVQQNLKNEASKPSKRYCQLATHEPCTPPSLMERGLQQLAFGPNDSFGSSLVGESDHNDSQRSGCFLFQRVAARAKQVRLAI